MQTYLHRVLPEMDDNGFGIKYEKNVSSYIPPHWHHAVELILLVKGNVTCVFENTKQQISKGDICIIRISLHIRVT